MTEPDEVNFFRNRKLTVDPYPYFEELRVGCPVHREPHQGVYMVSGYDEALSVYHDHATFSSCNTVSGPFVQFSVPVEGDDISAIIDMHRDELPFSDQLPSFDPPKHTAHRGLLMRLITPKRLKENEDFMWRLADRQLDEILPARECEFIGEFAQPFTLLVIADLLGVPEADHALLKTKLIEVSSGIGKRHEEMAHKPLEFLYEQFTIYIEERRRSPRADVMGSIARARFPDGSLPSVHDVALIAANLFTAGQETTARMLGFALQVIGERPDLQEQLRKDRSLIPAFIEEVLRLESPLKCQFRLARQTTDVAGVPVKAGETVLMLPGAANRDPRMFEDPAEFRLDRTNGRQHLAFGHGIHTCAGAPLARAEGRVALERILDQMSDIRLSEEHHGRPDDRHFDYLPTFFMRAIANLHLTYIAPDV
jgi:cytochrome P450